jgi:hypothetical protein
MTHGCCGVGGDPSLICIHVGIGTPTIFPDILGFLESDMEPQKVGFAGRFFQLGNVNLYVPSCFHIRSNWASTSKKETGYSVFNRIYRFSQ